MTGRVNAVLRLRSSRDGSIAVTVTSPDEKERLSVDDAALVVTIWTESADVMRCRFVDQVSGAVTYFQSSDASFRQFAQSIHLAASS